MLEDFRVPAFCPVCQLLMKGKSTCTYYDWKCCINCYIEFLEHSVNKQQQWKEGWRPSKEQIDIFLKKLYEGS